jgi:ATP-dependent helicase/nuclease subunit A
LSGEGTAPGAPPPLADQAERDRIETDLDRNILVEAGAGSGKTTALTDRMVALVMSGAALIEEIAAVTFTRKAAAELRERFQGALEAKLRECPPKGAERDRLNQALRGIDRAFLGTIHAFCARLLRERPLEAGIDPAFEETPEAEMLRLRKSYWHSFLERLVTAEDPALDELADVGLRLDALEAAFDTVSDNLDVPFAAEESAMPAEDEIDAIRSELERLLERGLDLMPAGEPAGGWDAVQKRLWQLAYRREVQDWSDRRRFFDSLSLVLRSRSYRATQNRWSDSGTGKAAAKSFQNELNAFVGEGGAARELHNRWLAHRYAISIRLVTRAAGDLAAGRRREGRLDFQDLLLLAAQLLRENPGARRDLGARYRRLLVDEFQDTDPLQAEVLLLLASEPETPGEDWRTVVPRDGALFVVGDPKQSIYRFRRADIVVYDFVRRRFEEFGEVLKLVTNFRSRQGIADLVNRTFGEKGLFPERATPQQAAFAPLVVRPKEEPAPREGVFQYELGWSSNQRSRAEDEAKLLAEWVAGRLAAEDGRSAGNFLILTRVRKHLDLYARALEERNVPVDVSGARVGIEAELSELMTLLAALADPEDKVKTVAVLTGLFFGLDLEELTEHRLRGGQFRPTDDPARMTEGTEVVRAALARLRAWWLRSIHVPADVLLGELCAELGLLPYAATGSLGGVRAGTIAYGLDAVRARALSGDASLVGATEALATALAWEEAETPLEPGRPDLVRVMNVHRAKGLEAPVVVLTGAELEGRHPVNLHVERPATGDPVAYMVIQKRDGPHRWVDLARPLDWTRRAAEERAFDESERDRLLYVAGTRAQDELVIGRIPGKDESPWKGYYTSLSAMATKLELRPGDPPAKEESEVSPAEIERSIAVARDARRALGSPTYLMESVTALAKGERGEEAAIGAERVPAAELPPMEPRAAEGDEAASGPRGYEWGSAVHAALAAAARGMEGEPFRLFCRTLLVEFELPVDDTGEPEDLEDLLELVRQVQVSELWRRAESAEERHVEVPFAAPYDGSEALPDVSTTVEGVIDLAFREPNGWVIADYKTDRGDDPEFERRSRTYRRQVEIYADCWAQLTGDPVAERILFFTALGSVESW